METENKTTTGSWAPIQVPEIQEQQKIELALRANIIKAEAEMKLRNTIALESIAVSLKNVYSALSIQNDMLKGKITSSVFSAPPNNVVTKDMNPKIEVPKTEVTINSQAAKEIIAMIVHTKPELTISKVSELVQTEKSKAAGLLTEEAAARLVATNLGINPPQVTIVPENTKTIEEKINYYRTAFSQIEVPMPNGVSIKLADATANKRTYTGKDKYTDNPIPFMTHPDFNIISSTDGVKIRIPYVRDNEGWFSSMRNAIEKMGGDWKGNLGKESHFWLP